MKNTLPRKMDRRSGARGSDSLNRVRGAVMGRMGDFDSEPRPLSPAAEVPGILRMARRLGMGAVVRAALARSEGRAA